MLKTGTIIVALLSATAAAADVRPMPADGRFCPSWAEAHERTLASLNNGRGALQGPMEGLHFAQEGRAGRCR